MAKIVNLIDWTTITDQPNAMPTAKIDAFSLGYNATVRLQRVGNIVIASAQTIVFNIGTMNVFVKLNGIIVPIGFRPVYHGNIFGQSQDSNSVNHTVSWSINPDGSVYISNRGTGNGRDTLLGMWFTNDPWPTS